MIRELLFQATESLRIRGAGNPRLEAELLLAHVLQRPRTYLYTHPEAQPPEAEEQCFNELLGRRLAGEPLQYVLGTAPFRHLILQVGPGVLIPRAETEVLVDVFWAAWTRRTASRAGRRMRATARPPWVIDVGVGSGAILLALLAEARRDPARAFAPLAIDIAWPPLLRTAENSRVCGLPLPARVRGDGLTAIDPRADVAAIVSNPPYVTTAEMRGLPVEIREYEPFEALHGGADGLDAIRRLLDESRPWVDRGAFLCFEMGGEQEAAVREELAGRGWLSMASVHRDLAGRPRIVLVEDCVPRISGTGAPIQPA